MVCKLVLDDDNGFVVGEVEVQSIGDDALFLGDQSVGVCFGFELSWVSTQLHILHQ